MSWTCARRAVARVAAVVDRTRRNALEQGKRHPERGAREETTIALTEIERDHLKALEKRQDHLARRVAESDRDLSYDRKELSALRWAIGMLGGPVPPGMVLVKRGGRSAPRAESVFPS